MKALEALQTHSQQSVPLERATVRGRGVSLQPPCQLLRNCKKALAYPPQGRRHRGKPALEQTEHAHRTQNAAVAIAIWGRVARLSCSDRDQHGGIIVFLERISTALPPAARLGAHRGDGSPVLQRGVSVSTCRLRTPGAGICCHRNVLCGPKLRSEV